MEKILLLQNKHWQGKPYTGLYNRHILSRLLKKMALKEIQVLLGIRRGGKSTIFNLLINHLLQEERPRSILYINLDDPYYAEIYNDARQLYQVIETAEKLTGEKADYLFLDEVQNVRDWEQFVKSVYDSGVFKKIFVTGSNSSLLQGEYSRLLSGRYTVDYISPFSFAELLEVHGIDSRLATIDNRPKILRLVDDILEYGSFPEVIKHEDRELKREILLGYFDTIILKDCIAGSRIRDIKTFKTLVYYLISNNGALYSYNSLSKGVGSNENTIKEFVGVLENSFLLQEITGFSYSLVKQIRGRKKSYFADNGFLANMSFRFSANKGRLMENLVYTELLKCGGTVYFYNPSQAGECDFIVQNGRDFTAFQVCFELTDQNRKREISGLKTAMDKLRISNGVIITYNQAVTENGMVCVPFWDYFGALK